jgi:hypothetical protein
MRWREIKVFEVYLRLFHRLVDPQFDCKLTYVIQYLFSVFFQWFEKPNETDKFRNETEDGNDTSLPIED